MKSAFSPSWKSSKQPRKQRKYLYNMPHHIASKTMAAHLSPELREKYNKRSIRVRVGDKVKVMRGSFKGEESKVERVDSQRRRVYLTKVERIKKDGTKILVPFDPSNLMITELNLDDKKRMKQLPKKNKGSKGEDVKDG